MRFFSVSFRSSTTPMLSEEQLWSTGLRGLKGIGGAAAIICHTGGGLGKDRGRKEDKGRRRKRVERTLNRDLRRFCS